MLKEKYISEAQMKEEPKKKLALKIKEGSITPEHFNKRLVDEYLISVVDSVEDTGMLPEDKAKLDALPTAEELQQALDGKQNDLTFDSTPTVNSNNPVKSKGIKAELDKKQDKLTNGWVVQIKDEEAGSSGIIHKPKLINEDGNEVNVIVGATDRYSGWEQGGDTRIPTIGLVKEKLAAIDVTDQISGKANKSEMSVVAGTGANADKTTITLKNGTSATVLTQHQDVSEFIKEGEVFGTGDDSTASFNPYSDTVWNKTQTLSENQKQQIRENIGVGAADNEDIQNVSGELKFADKAYNTSSHSGLGRKYLRKNIVTSGGVEKNVLTQAMVNTSNTIYHIQYDYDLNGQTITLPAGCVLEFEGGSLANGTIVGNNTTIKADVVTVFGEGIVVSGTWSVSEAYPEWFGAKGDGVTDDSNAFSKLFLFQCASISLSNTYAIKGEFNVENKIINGNNEIIKAIGKTRFIVVSSSIYDVEFDVNNQSVERAFLILSSGVCAVRGCTIKNIKGVEYKDGAYAVTVYIQEAESYITNCKFIDISDRRRAEGQIGDYRNGGFTGAIYYRPNSANTWVLTNNPKQQYVEKCFVDKCYTLTEDGRIDSTTTAYDADAIRIFVNEDSNDYYKNQFYSIKDIVVNNVQKRIIKSSGGYNLYAENIICEELLPTYSDNFCVSMIANSNNIEIKNLQYKPVADRSVLSSINLIGISNSAGITIDGFAVQCSNHKATPFYITDSFVTIKNTSVKGNIKYLTFSTNSDVNIGIDFDGQVADNNVIHSDGDNNVVIQGDYHAVNNGSSLSVAVVRVVGCPTITFNGNIYNRQMAATNIVNCQNVYISGSIDSNGAMSVLGSANTPINFANIDADINESFLGVDYLIFRYINNLKLNLYASVDYSNITIDQTNKGKGLNITNTNFISASINKFILNNLSTTEMISPVLINGGVLDLIIGNDVTISDNIHLITSNTQISKVKANLPKRSTKINYIRVDSSISYFDGIDWTYIQDNPRTSTSIISKGLDRYCTVNQLPNTCTIFDTGYRIFETTSKKPVYWNGAKWVESDGCKAAVLRSGVFADKPSASDINIGFRYFCTDRQTTEGVTDGIEIIHKGNDVWVDALGRVVS